MHKRAAFASVLLALSVSVAACAVPTSPTVLSGPKGPTVTPITLVVSPAATISTVPSAAPPPAATVPSPVPTAVPPTLTPSVVVTATATATMTLHPDGNCKYSATFVADVTIRDNALMPAGSTFVKTWRIRNDGTCTWGAAGYRLHSLVFTGGDKLGAPDSVQLPAEVRQGAVIDISVPMVAPTTPGQYRSEWMLQVDNGARVGFGPGLLPLYTQINVTPPPPQP